MKQRELLWWYYCTPYGIWVCANKAVLFNRRYEPIVVHDAKHGPRIPASCPMYRRDYEHWEVPEDHRNFMAEFVNWKRQWWFYNDGNLPWRSGRASAETRVRVMLILADFLDGKMPVPTVLQ